MGRLISYFVLLIIRN